MRSRYGWLAAALLTTGTAVGGPVTDRHGDPLPAGAVARLGTVRWHVPGQAQAVAYSPDGKSLAVASVRLPRITLFDADTGLALRRFDLPRGSAYRLAFAPDGKALAAVAGDAVCVWDTATGRRWDAAPPAAPGTDWFAWSADGRTLAWGGLGSRIGRWDCQARRELQPLSAGEGLVMAVCHSPDGRTLSAVRSDGVVLAWDLATGKELRRFNTAPADRDGAAFSPDGRLLAVAGRGKDVRLWDTANGRELRRLAADDPVSRTAFSADGRTLFGAAGARLVAWDTDAGTVVQTIDSSPGQVTGLAVSPDGRALAGADPLGPVHLWDLNTGRDRSAAAQRLTRVAWSPDGRALATGGAGKAAQLWDAAGGRPLAALPSGPVDEMAFSPDGLALTTAATPDVYVWDVATGRPLRRLRLDNDWVGVPALFADGCRLVVPFRDGKTAGLRFWETATGRREGERLFQPAARCLAVSPDGRRVAGFSAEQDFSDRRIRIWPADPAGAGVNPVTLQVGAGAGAGQQIGFSFDGTLLGCCATKREVELWDPAFGKFLRGVSWEGEVAPVASPPACRFAFSPDDRWLATAGPDSAVRVWEVATAKLVLRLDGHLGPVTAVAFSPDGTRLASASEDATALVWDLALAVGALPPFDGDRLWGELGSEDAAAAYRAIAALVGAPARAVPLLRERLAGRDRPAGGGLTRLVADLDAPRFADRERASRLLNRPEYGPVLRAVVAGPVSPEVWRRADAILKRLDEREWPARALRPARAVAVLERVGSPDARLALREVGDGDDLASWLARAAVARLERRADSPGQRGRD
jgi:WD40 repeat protein